MTLVNKNELKSIGMVGPIAEGETPEQAIIRMEEVFNRKCEKFAFQMHDEPLHGENQQFPVIIGAVWSEQ